jgi:hypothetical protein
MSGKSRRLLAAAIVPGAVAAAVLAGAGAAGASTGTRYASAEQVGYAATGAQFRLVQASVYLRNPAQYAGAVGQYSQTVQLRSSGLLAVAGVSASTSGSSYTPYAKIYDATTHQLLASDPGAQWCDEANPDCVSTIGSFPAGDTMQLSVWYDPKRGGLGLSARDDASGSGVGVFLADYTAGAGESFNQARVGTEFGPDPWTAPSSFTHPAAWTKIAAWNWAELYTYNGKRSTLASWFVHHKIFMVGVTGSLIDVQAAPTDLTNNGAAFQDWLAPAGVNGPAQPPQG